MPSKKRNLHLDVSLLPIYQEYKSVEGNQELSLWNYLGMRADYDLAVAFSKLFWPDFIEIDNCVLLSEAYDPTHFNKWKEHFQGDGPRIEAAVNRTRLDDLFMHVPEGVEFSVQLLEYLAQCLLMCWKHALEAAFPDRRFTFYYGTLPEESSPTITFHQRT